MKKQIIVLLFATILALGLTACGNEEASSNASTVTSAVQSDNRDENNNNQSKEDDGWSSDDFQGPWTKTFDGDGQDVVGWDGEWTGGDVKVTIRLADSYVQFNDAEMHNASCDEVSVEGDVITAIYRITLDMYDNPDTYMLPEQEWTIVLKKDGATINYSRTAILTFFDFDAEGNMPEPVEKTAQATLTKITKQ